MRVAYDYKSYLELFMMIQLKRTDHMKLTTTSNSGQSQDYFIMCLTKGLGINFHIVGALRVDDRAPIDKSNKMNE